METQPKGIFDRLENAVNNFLKLPPIDWEYRNFVRKAVKENPQIRFDEAREIKLQQAYQGFLENKDHVQKIDGDTFEALRKTTIKLEPRDVTRENENALKRDAYKLLLKNIQFIKGPASDKTDLLLKRYYREYFSPALDKKRIFTADKIVKDLAAWGIEALAKSNTSSVTVIASKLKTELLAGPAPDRLFNLYSVDNFRYDTNKVQLPSINQTFNRYRVTRQDLGYAQARLARPVIDARKSATNDTTGNDTTNGQQLQ